MKRGRTNIYRFIMLVTLCSCLLNVNAQDLVRSNSTFQLIVDKWQQIDSRCFNITPVVHKNVPLYKSVDDLNYSVEASYIESADNIDLHTYYSDGEIIRVDVFTTGENADIHSIWYYSEDELIYVKKDYKMFADARTSVSFDKYDFDDYQLEYFFDQGSLIGWYLDPTPERDLEEKVVRILEKDMKHDAKVFASYPKTGN